MKKKKTGLIVLLISLVLICIIGITTFLIPIPFSKISLYTETQKYEAQVSYQEYINRDNCDSDSSCVCTSHGGFLWLTCNQCSCTRHRTEVREKLVIKEKSVTGYATVFKIMIKERISKANAEEQVKYFMDFFKSKTYIDYQIQRSYRSDNVWNVVVLNGGTELIVEVNSVTGKLIEINRAGYKIPIEQYYN